MSASLQFGPEWMRKGSTRSASNSSNKESDSLLDSSPPHPNPNPQSTKNSTSSSSSSSTIQQRRQPSLSSLHQPSSGPTPVKNPSIRSPGGFSFAAAASAAAGGAAGTTSLSSPLTSSALTADTNEAESNQKDSNLRYSRERLLSLYAGGATNPLDQSTAAATVDPTSPGSTPTTNGTGLKKKVPGAQERDFSSLRSPNGVESGGTSSINSNPRSTGGGVGTGDRTERERERSGGLFQRPSGGTGSALHSPTATSSHRDRFAGIQGGVLSGVGPNVRRKKEGESEVSLSPNLERGTWSRTSSVTDASAKLRGKSSDKGPPVGEPDSAARPSRFKRDTPLGPPADGSAGFRSRRERIPSLAGASSDADSWRVSTSTTEPATNVNGSLQDDSSEAQNGVRSSADVDADSALASHATSILGSLSLDAHEEAGLGIGSGTNGTFASEAAAAAPPPPEWKVEDQQWFYRDPAGNEQGPFPAATMHDWHAQSYFNNDLLMRREQESDFLPLGEIIALLGNSATPFLLPPPAPTPVAPPPPPPAAEASLPLRDQLQSDIGAFGQRNPIDQALPGQPGYSSPFHQSADLGRNGWGGPDVNPRGWLPNLDLGFGGSQSAQSPGALPGSPFGAPQQAYGVSPFGGPRDEYSLHQQRETSRGPEFGQLGSDPFGNGQSWDPSGGVGWNGGQNLMHQSQSENLQQQGIQQPNFFDRFNQQPQPLQHTPQMEPQQAWGSPRVPYEANQHAHQAQQQQAPWDGIQALKDANNETSSVATSEKSHVPGPIGTPRRARSPAPSTVATEEPAASIAQEAAAPSIKTSTQEEDKPVVQTPPAEEPAIEQLWPQSPSAVEFASEPSFVSDASADQSSAQQHTGGNDDFASRVGKKTRRSVKKLELDGDDSRSGSPVRGGPTSGSVRVVSEEQFHKGGASANTPGSTQAPLSAWMPESGSGTPTSATAKAAPWAGQTSSSKEEGLSLRQIQEAESRRAEAQRALRAAASQRAGKSSGSPTASINGDSLPTNMSWGLASIPSTATSSKSSVVDASSAWSAPSKAPKKTLMEIQEEERLRAQRAREAQAGLRKAYADSASKQGTSTGISTAAAVGAGWNVVGASGKPSTPTNSTTTTPPVAQSIANVVAKPSTQRAISLGASQTSGGAWSVAGSKTNGGPPTLPASVPPKPPAQTAPSKSRTQAALNEPSGDAQPSTEFIKYCKDQLKGLNIKVDDFIEMLLSFPLDPSPDVIEIIAESVYANSSTLDGRRFAADFVAKRKLDASGRGAPNLGRGGPSGYAGNSMRSSSDVLKGSGAAKPDSGFGFKVVKKGKKGK